MAHDVLQSLVDSLADRLGRSVVIDDASFRLAAASRHFGDEDAVRVTTVMNRAVRADVVDKIVAAGVASWNTPGRVAVDIPGVLPRWCAPIRCCGELLGYLWLIDSGAQLAGAELALAANVAERASATLHMGSHPRRRPRCEEALRSLIAGDPAARRQAEEILRADGALGAPSPGFQLISVHPDYARDRGHGPRGSTQRVDCDAALLAAVRDGLRVVPGEDHLVVLDNGLAWTLLVTSGRPQPAHAATFGQAVAVRFAALTGQAGHVAVGAGPVVDHVDAIAETSKLAALAARAAAVFPERSGFVRSEELGPYEVLLRIPSDEMRSLARLPAMEALGQEDRRGVLIATLEAYFNHGGDVRRTATALCVHRATLYDRLRRIESVTGCSLRDGDDRLTLHLGVKLRALDAALHAVERNRTRTG